MKNNFLSQIQSHFDRQIETGKADFGPCPTAMWMSSLDTRTGKYPEDDSRPSQIPRRHYRAIDAPKGCSFYWDQPLLEAAFRLSEITGNGKYADAASEYIRDFLKCCIAENGVFLWGNHYYWDAFRGCTVKFIGEENAEPVNFKTEKGDFHEVRPLPPRWDLFWKISPQAAEGEIRRFTENSIFGKEGGFNRHADRKKGCAFLESGGILAESLAWLYSKTGDVKLLDKADSVMQFSYSHRNTETGLLEVNPTQKRWDKHACSTEVGLWAGSLLRAAEYAEYRKEWQEIAAAAVSAYLKYGYDEQAEHYYGKLNTADGTPVLGTPRQEGDSELSLKHQPGDYSDIWRPLFPAHDYPMQFAESCLSLYELTGRDVFRTACGRWNTQIRNSLPARNGAGAYAEQYGRVIAFLSRCASVFKEVSYSETASAVTEETIEILFDKNMFRTHPGENRYDAVDGLGFLFNALLDMENENI